MTALWESVAAPGTDPEALARCVARLAGPRGDPRTVAREAVALATRGTSASGPSSAIAGLVARLAPPPSALLRSAADAVAAAWARLGVRAAVVGDPAYPARLALGWPATGGPLVLASRGPSGGIPDRPTVAIVGARRATPYGTGIASWLGAAAADAGCLVVSGGALGIDAAAHAATLHVPGATAVVLGCGHAVTYPRPHAVAGALFDRVLAAGGWVASELPPDVPPRPANVLARNRIVAGLADAVVVVEGGARSGSLRTAAIAAERGIPVLAVPGDVRAPGSAAPHRLLADGAAPCAGPDDMLEAVTGALAERRGPDAGTGGGPSALPAAVRHELERRWPRPARAGDLASAAGIPVGRLLAALTSARVAGEIAESPEGIRLRRAPARSST